MSSLINSVCEAKLLIFEWIIFRLFKRLYWSGLTQTVSWNIHQSAVRQKPFSTVISSFSQTSHVTVGWFQLETLVPLCWAFLWFSEPFLPWPEQVFFSLPFEFMWLVILLSSTVWKFKLFIPTNASQCHMVWHFFNSSLPSMFFLNPGFCITLSSYNSLFKQT